MTPISFLGGKVILYPGDCRIVLKQLADNSIDSICCDPPYHLQSIVKRFGGKNSAPAKDGTDGAFKRASAGFMGKQWDGGDIAFRPKLWAEVLRVLKPGGYIMAFSGCRTYHHMACAIEDAGFITHPFFAWAFGSGFPKAHSVSKEIDKRGGKSVNWFGQWLRKWREEKGVTQKQVASLFPSKTGKITGCVANWELGFNLPTNEQFNLICNAFEFPFESMEEAERDVIGHKERGPGWFTAQNGHDITASATDAAREWDGWFYGTQSLKPAIEPIYFGQKPFERGLNGAQNVLKWGVGAINVAGCKVGSEPRINNPASSDGDVKILQRRDIAPDPTSVTGRWPANLIHDGSEEVLACFPESDSTTCGRNWDDSVQDNPVHYKHNVKSGVHFGDSGSAARFFYTSKADADDRLGSKHPTVKPLDLIQYLVRLITPHGGTCLDLFAGTGTTGEACFREGFRAILIERESEYIADIERRMSLVMSGRDERAHVGMKARGRPRDDGPLFAGSDADDANRGKYGRDGQSCKFNLTNATFGRETSEIPPKQPLDLVDLKIKLADIALAAGRDIEVRFTKAKEEAPRQVYGKFSRHWGKPTDEAAE